GYRQANFANTDLNAGIGVRHAQIPGEIELGVADPALEIHVTDLRVSQSVNDELSDAAFNIERFHRLSLRFVECDFGLPHAPAQMHPVDLKAGHLETRFTHAHQNIEIKGNLVTQPQRQVIILPMSAETAAAAA